MGTPGWNPLDPFGYGDGTTPFADWPEEREPPRFDEVNLRPVLHVCQIAWTGVDHLGERGFEVWCSCGGSLSPLDVSQSRAATFVELHERVPCNPARFAEARERLRAEQRRYMAALDTAARREVA